MQNCFYLHFEKALSESEHKELAEYCDKINPVFTGSFQILFDGSPSQFRHLLRTLFEQKNYYLSIQKSGVHHQYLDD